MGIFQSPFSFVNFSGVDIVTITVGVQPLCGLIGKICELSHKPANVPDSGSAVQTMDCQPAVIVNSGNNRCIRLESNTIFCFMDTAICIGVRIEFFHLKSFPFVLLYQHYNMDWGFCQALFLYNGELFFPIIPSPEGLGDFALIVAVHAVFLIG